jgi:hypothetical protein
MRCFYLRSLFGISYGCWASFFCHARELQPGWLWQRSWVKKEEARALQEKDWGIKLDSSWVHLSSLCKGMKQLYSISSQSTMSSAAAVSSSFSQMLRHQQRFQGSFLLMCMILLTCNTLQIFTTSACLSSQTGIPDPCSPWILIHKSS